MNIHSVATDVVLYGDRFGNITEVTKVTVVPARPIEKIKLDFALPGSEPDRRAGSGWNPDGSEETA